VSATIDRSDVEAAAGRIAGRVRRTPTLAPGRGAFGVPADLILKLELLQHTGSFKPRGAFSKMLASQVGPAGVIAASGGNFGVAVAFAARRLGHAAEVFVPSTSPSIKGDRIRAQGATVTVVPGVFDDAWSAMEERAAETGALMMHPFDQPEVAAGQGSIAIEIEEQIPEADTVLVAVGGGGLIAGIAAGLRGRMRVVAVEPVSCPTLFAAREAGEPVEVQVGGLAVDSLGTRRLGTIAFDVTNRWVDRLIQVDDDDILDAQRMLWRETSLIAEPGGAAALAALTSDAYVPEPDERVAVLVCGANADLGYVTNDPDAMAEPASG
jgi:threonine dehydratase